MRGKEGFTLIELMAIICIVLALTVTIAPRIRDFYRKQQLDVAIQELATDLKIARNRAKTQREERRVVIMDSNYVIINIANNSIEKNRTFTGVTFTSGVPVDITFDRNGMISRPVIITGARCGVPSQTLHINSLGRVSRVVCY
ncbi:TPA: hypothetical protein DCX15_06290 [bacterium]|nr:hypothetical protein [bacterium]